jgi:hypothetical protein
MEQIKAPYGDAPVTNETEIADCFNEVDPSEPGEEILRTLEDFQIFDEEGHHVPLHALGERDTKATAIGFVVEPLPIEWRLKLLQYSCAVSSTLVEGEL